MEELLKSYEHPLYPFVGSWIPRLTEIAGEEFKYIKELRNKIISELRNTWMKYKQDEDISYYKGFLRFQNEYKSVLRIFSLNYDCCIEDACEEAQINRGFDTNNHIWNWRNFENEDNSPYNIVLYKLHGSVDWAKNSSGQVESRKSGINDNELRLIFGTTYKLQYLDPFLYLIHEFRRKTLDEKTKAIISIGYSFNDDHINGIIGQSIKDNPKRRIIVVSPNKNQRDDIMLKIGIDEIENIQICQYGAKEYLSKILSIKSIEEKLPDEDPPF